MTFEEALVILDIDATVDDKVARRAYLRAVKAHPPERDPEGFRRVREAYDLVRDELPYRRHEACEWEEDEPEDPVAHPATPADVVDVEKPRPPTAQASEPANALPVRTNTANSQAVLEERLEELEYGSDEAIRVCREAVTEDPEAASLRWSLIEQLEYACRDEDVTAELLRAHREGVPGFLVSLLWTEPASLSRKELAQAAAQPETRAAAASAYAKLNQPVRAAKLLVSALHESERDESATPDLTTCTSILFSLLAKGKWKTASRLQSALRASSERAALNERSFEGGGEAQWLLASELLAVRNAVPEAIVLWMAEALSHAEPLEHARELVLFADAQPRAAARALKVLERDAPNLYQIFHSSLASGRRSTTRSSGRGWLGPVLFGVVLLNIVRFAGKTLEPEEATRNPANATPTSAASIAAERGRYEVVPLLRRIENALASADCSVSQRDVDYALTLADARGADSTVLKAITKLQNQYRLTCAALSAEAGP